MNITMSDGTPGRMLKQLLAVGLVGLALLGAVGCAVLPSPPAAAPDADVGIVRIAPSAGERPDSIDVLVQRHMDSREIPGVSLAVMRGSEVVKVTAYGRANVELDVAASPVTVFPYASMAKVFTGTAVLQLVQQGRLSIEDRIADLLPDLPQGWDAVTVRHLLDHTSGLPDLNERRTFTNPFLAPTESRAEILAALKAQPVQFAPGDRFAYNQTNYLLLALLLEEHDGRTVDEYVREEFAEPLGLGSLVYGDARRLVPARASWYTRLDFTSGTPEPSVLRPLWIEYPPWLHTAAGLNGTALDLARFVSAVASGQLLDLTLRREMWTPARLSDGSVFRFEDGSTGAGLGWWVHDDPSSYWVGMGGGASSALRHYVDDELTVVVLTNLQGSAPEEIVEEIAESYLRRAAEEPASQPGPATLQGTPYESRFVDAGGVRLHYLDFGGEGLPLVFVHSEAWDAHTYAAFAPRFADQNRVVAVTRPGYGESEAHPDGFDVATQARSLIDFLDALEIEQAVFAGNASASAELTFLGEHHADRVAGLIYFTGLAVPWLEEHDSDPTRAFEMFRRASPGAGDAAERTRARKSYRPEFLRTDQPTIPVPTLAFVARSGTKGGEHGMGALALVGSPLMEDVRSEMPPSPVRTHLERLASDEDYRARQLEQIADPEARDYFLRLAGDRELQERMYRYHEEVVLPALREAQERFRRAFGDDLRLIRLDVDHVVGYEYRDAPELIEPHVQRFLEEVREREGVNRKLSR